MLAPISIQYPPRTSFYPRFTQAKLKAVRDKNRHLTTQINVLRNTLSNSRGDDPYSPQRKQTPTSQHSPELSDDFDKRQEGTEDADTDDMIDAFGSL
jgi:hypothetical protein